MVFSSTVFLFLFLPISLLLYFILDKKYKNVFLLLISLFFYAWGEYNLVLIMAGSVVVNYFFGIIIELFSVRGQKKLALYSLISGVSINLLFLIYYKYIHFLVENLNLLNINISTDFSQVTLPVGISFFTFQSISYLVDVYRKSVSAQRSIVNLGMYISLFPQLIAGPIVRYADITKEIETRSVNSQLFVSGISRFIIGLAKKVIIANNLGLIADKVFGIPADDLSSLSSWIGILAYSLQIYYDFSGYSDMAIGLGRMFGFNFKENFNFPYVASSIKDFWRRWHISLSSWFRDYLYIPLGGNKKGKFRTYINLFIVFFVTGLWHGASWSFIVWGLFHGLFLILEKLIIIKLPSKIKFLGHFYAMIVVMIGWVLFRADNLNYGLNYIFKMFTFSQGNNNSVFFYMNIYTYIIFSIGIIFSIPFKTNKRFIFIEKLDSLKYTGYILLLIFSIFELAQSTHNPFIYYRF